MQSIVPPLAITGMIVSMLLSIGVPILLAILWHKRTKAKWSAVFIGAATFYVFVQILEGSLHALCLGLISPNPISTFITGTPWAYVLYGAFAAGIFEETGRLVAFKWLLKRQTSRETSVMYGIGHGGIEAILIGGVSMISNLAFSFSLNASGPEAMLAAATDPAAVQQSISILNQTAPGMFFASGIERMFALLLHIGLSVLVFAAVRQKGKFYLYPVAILLHAGVDIFAGLYQLGIISNVWVIELIVAVLAVSIGIYALRLYRQLPKVAPAVDEVVDVAPGAELEIDAPIEDPRTDASPEDTL